MTIQGALNDLSNLINSSDIPMYYKPSLKKIKETIELEMQPKMGEWLTNPLADYTGEGYFICSKCENDVYDVSDYCPNCGADMRGDANDE